MTRVKNDKQVILKLPDFHLIRPDEMIADKNHGTKAQWSLVISNDKRFPYQPPMPAYPAALLHDKRLEKVRTDHSRALLRLTDDAFARLELHAARDRAIAKHVHGHHDEVHDANRRFDVAAVAAEEMRKAHFFHEVRRIMLSRERAHYKARRLQLALFKFIRDHSEAHARHEELHTRRLIIEGFARHAGFLAWRLNNLFVETATHGVMRVKGHGQLLENIIGHVLWDLRHIITQKHHSWRLDNLYIPLPNAGIVKIHHSGGMPLEHATAVVHEPVLHRELEKFAKWHGSINEILTANGGMVHALHQGHEPGRALAMVTQPVLDERLRHAVNWHATKLLETLPNGGFAAATKNTVGKAPEKITGDIAWRGRDKITLKHSNWRLNHQFTTAANGLLVSADKHHGHSMEKASADTAAPHKEAVTQKHRQWHQEHRFQKTPNGGFAPLKTTGNSYEAITAQVAGVTHEHTSAATKLWHETHTYTETATGLRPIRLIGKSFEHVTNSISRRIKDRITARFFDRYKNDLYIITANGGFRRVGPTGKAHGRVTSDVSKQEKKAITQTFTERRKNEFYVPTGNGNWRRLQGGQPIEQVTGEVMRPGSETPGTIGLPAQGGHVIESAKTEMGEHKFQEGKRALFELRRSLAAHEVTVSRLQGHVVHLNTLNTPTNGDTLALTGPGKAKKV